MPEEWSTAAIERRFSIAPGSDANRWVGRRKQRPTSEPDSEISDVDNHRRIKQIRRPELPARPTFQPSE